MLRLLFPYLLFGTLGLIVLFDNVGSRDGEAGSGGIREVVSRDLVCQMDVGDRITAEYAGRRYHFCTENCRELFLAAPGDYLSENCLVCLADQGIRKQVSSENPAYTWQDTTYHFCLEDHRAAFAADPAGYFIHSMWGIPDWLYGSSIAVVLILSFGLFEWIARSRRNKPPSAARIDLLSPSWIGSLVRWAPFRFLCQLIFVLLFALIIVAGLFGNQLAALNIAPLMTWTIWWGGLVVLIMFFGKAWCYVCPWDAVAGWVERLRFWGKGKEGLGLGLSWPKPLRNIFLATAFFVGLTWLELGFGITMNPQATAMLGLGMLSLTLLAVLVFERRAFCRYGCLVGRVSGLYALFSATEVRAREPELCHSCATQDCYKGNEKGFGCPTNLFPGTLKQNTYCINCMECVKTCPSDNMTVRARPWGADLVEKGRPRRDEAYLALLMLAITGFHGLTMTKIWKDMLGFFEESLQLAYIPAFSFGMFLLLAGPILIYAILVKGTVILGRNPQVSYDRAFIAFAYSLLPIALFYHLAHNLEHMLMEGQKVIPLLSNPLGYLPGESWSFLGAAGIGPWNLFGTAEWVIAPLVSLPSLWIMQVILVLVGHVFALWVADCSARNLYPAKGAAFRSQIPMLIGMVLFSIFSLWLLKQPMEMRSSAM